MDIEWLVLKTSDIRKLRGFYVDILGFVLVEEREEGFRLKVGTSELEFVRDDKGDNPLSLCV